MKKKKEKRKKKKKMIDFFIRLEKLNLQKMAQVLLF